MGDAGQSCFFEGARIEVYGLFFGNAGYTSLVLCYLQVLNGDVKRDEVPECRTRLGWNLEKK